MLQLRMVTWDLLAWLPRDPAVDLPSTGTGLNSDTCWESVCRQAVFGQLMMEIWQHPADIVMWKLT